MDKVTCQKLVKANSTKIWYENMVCICSSSQFFKFTIIFISSDFNSEWTNNAIVVKVFSTLKDYFCVGGKIRFCLLCATIY